MAVQFNYSSSFEEARKKIEQHYFDSIMSIEEDFDKAIDSVVKFSEAVDRLVDTLEQMYQNPILKDIEGEKSFPIRDGHLRVFYKVSALAENQFAITFIDVDHNKQSNIDRFPNHSIITFDDES